MSKKIRSKVIVGGSVNLDIVLSVKHLPKTGETIFGTLRNYLGGKGANQAVAASKMQISTIFLGTIGQDEYGQFVEQQLSNFDLQILLSKKKDVPTGIAMITVDEQGENTIVVTSGANYHFDTKLLQQVTINKGDAVVCQFEIPEVAIIELFQTAKQQHATTILNAAPAKSCSPALLQLTDYLVVNETELETLLHSPTNLADQPIAQLVPFCRQLLTPTNKAVILTLGRKGALYVSHDTYHHAPAYQVDAVDTTGAGDCFVGTFAAQITQQQKDKTTIPEMLRFCNATAALCVTRKGTSASMGELGEVEGLLEEYS